ncbi:MAG: AAA family ATPase [Planctomycetaceae bacterium]|jgi:predicted ATPase|nr:AAA family ATPase [Planctomycetaceae bacterium]
MGVLEGFWVRNFKSLKQVGLGTCFPKFVYIDDETRVLPYHLNSITLLTGNNGTGKSSALDAFSFVSDCYRHGVDFACLKRGGYDTIYSHGSKGSLSFGFHYREKEELEAVTYALSIVCAKNKFPFIESELLAYQRGKESLPIFFLQNGVRSIRYLAPDEQLGNTELTKIEFTDYKNLGLASLQSHPKFPVLASLRNLFENWVLNNFTPVLTRKLDLSLSRHHESQRGMNLSGLVGYVLKRYGTEYEMFFQRIASLLPDVETILVDSTQVDRPLLAFKMLGIQQPIPITHLSEGIVRLFAYTILLEENDPAPLIILEEPENGLDWSLRANLINQIHHVFDNSQNTQLVMTTHHHDFADSLHPSQVWVFEKNQEGFTVVERASDALVLQEMMEGNQPIDSYWFSKRFGTR